MHRHISTHTFGALTLAACLTTLVCTPMASWTLHGADRVAPETRRQAPDFTLTDSKGGRFQLSAQRGKVVLVDFWATWCTGCKQEIPWFVEFHAKYQAKGLEAVGIAMDEEGWDKVRPYLTEHPIRYPVVVGDLTLLKTFGLDPSLPITLLVDRHGRIAETHVGVVDKSFWEQRLRQLLAER